MIVSEKKRCNKPVIYAPCWFGCCGEYVWCEECQGYHNIGFPKLEKQIAEQIEIEKKTKQMELTTT